MLASTRVMLHPPLRTSRRVSKFACRLSLTVFFADEMPYAFAGRALSQTTKVSINQASPEVPSGRAGTSRIPMLWHYPEFTPTKISFLEILFRIEKYWEQPSKTLRHLVRGHCLYLAKFATLRQSRNWLTNFCD